MASKNLLNLCMNEEKSNRLTSKCPCYEKRNVYWSNRLTEVTYIPSRRSMSNVEKECVWYTGIQFEKFARDEVERRKTIGMESRQILCSEVVLTEY